MGFNPDKWELNWEKQQGEGVFNEWRDTGKLRGTYGSWEMIPRSLKAAEQVNQGDERFAFISHGVENKSKEFRLELYRALGRLEHCVQLCSPHYRKDVSALEGVQRRFNRTLPGVEGLSDKDRPDRLRLFSLEQRRLRGVGDRMEGEKIMGTE